MWLSIFWGPVGCPGLVLLMVMAEAPGYGPTAPASANIPLEIASHMATGKVKRHGSISISHGVGEKRVDYLLSNGLIDQ